MGTLIGIQNIVIETACPLKDKTVSASIVTSGREYAKKEAYMLPVENKPRTNIRLLSKSSAQCYIT